MTLATAWPGMTPQVVWGLDLAEWWLFATAADMWEQEQRRLAAEAKTQRNS